MQAGRIHIAQVCGKQSLGHLCTDGAAAKAAPTSFTWARTTVGAQDPALQHLEGYTAMRAAYTYISWVVWHKGWSTISLPFDKETYCSSGVLQRKTFI